MKIFILTVCCTFAILKVAESAALQKKRVIATDNEEDEVQENKSLTLVDSTEKDLNTKDDFNVSFMKKRPIHKKNAAKNKKKTKSEKQIKPVGKKEFRNSRSEGRNYLLYNDSTPLDNTIQAGLAHDYSGVSRRNQNVDSLSGTESIEQRLEKFQPKENDIAVNNIKETQGNNEIIRRTLGGSVEDETVEDVGGSGGRRALDGERKFDDVYRYENEPLKQMLVWLVMTGINPSVKNAVQASKDSVDRYVKHTVDKAGAQAALHYTDYTSLRFDKDRIMMYCGGQLYVYNTLKDSKICFNGQVYEVRLI